MKRIAWRAGVVLGTLLVLGVVTSTSVAWGFATHDMGDYRREFVEWRGVIFTRLVGRGADRINAFVSSEWPKTYARLKETESIREPPAWSMMNRIVAPIQAEQAVGWPLPCLRCYWVTDQDSTGRAAFGVRGALGDRVSKPLPPPDAGYPFRPFIPIWSGLIADTALFASAWAVTLVAPMLALRYARRRLRWTHGLCTGCGYDLQGLHTRHRPECGGPRQRPTERA